MTQISSVFRAAPLLSPRTADYVSALIREGDNFDYAGWLQQVRAQDAQAQQSQQTSTSRKTVAKEIAPQIARPESLCGRVTGCLDLTQMCQFLHSLRSL
jgi:hypothetical protein